MSTCISRAGEFSAHETTEGNYICDLCGVLDEDGLFAERDALRAKVARVEALADRWGQEGVERGPDDTVYTAGVAAMIRAALSDAS